MDAGFNALVLTVLFGCLLLVHVLMHLLQQPRETRARRCQRQEFDVLVVESEKLHDRIRGLAVSHAARVGVGEDVCRDCGESMWDHDTMLVKP